LPKVWLDIIAFGNLIKTLGNHITKEKVILFEVLYTQQKNLYVESVQSAEIFCYVWVNQGGPSQE